LQSGIVPHSGEAEWKRILLLIAILAVIVLGSLSLTFFLLYSTAIDQHGGRLLEIAQSEARTIEAIARHEHYYLGSGDTSAPSYLDILVDAHEQYAGFGETGEFTLAKLEDGQIVFLLSHRHFDLDYPEPVSINSSIAEPMRRALQGESGTIIGLDYRGSVVLAAFEPVAGVDLGIVAKIDLEEVRAPYVRAALLSLGPAFVAILLGAVGFVRITRPIVRRIAEGQQHYQDLVETMHDGLGIQNEDGILQYVNRQYCQIMGRSREEVIGTPSDKYLTPESKTRFAQEMAQRRKGVALSYELSFIRPDGSEVATLISPQLIVDAKGVFRGSFATISEITKLKEVEYQLRSEKELAQKYLDIAGVMLVVLDRDGCIVMINKRGLEILGYADDSELLGRDWFSTCLPSDATESVRSVFDRLMAGKAEPVEYYENNVLTKDGVSRIIAWHNTVMSDAAGTPAGTLSSGNDITDAHLAELERIAMESHLRQGQKLESIGTLASGVAHEINNPLTGIINYAQLIHDRIEDPKLSDFAEGIIEEGNRVATIVKSLLSFSRQESERHSPADISDLLDSTLSLIGSVLRKDQIQLQLEIEPNLPLIKCRSQQIQQVLLNLLTNARHALNERYPEYDEDKILRVTIEVIEKEEQPWLRTVIEDHGAGIPQTIIDRVFDPFFSTKPRETGTSLGLSISYGLVREHHGQLLVESEPNVYTRFTMELPVETSWSLEA
jgi:PAS domain S-box-containing protein